MTHALPILTSPPHIDVKPSQYLASAISNSHPTASSPCIHLEHGSLSRRRRRRLPALSQRPGLAISCNFKHARVLLYQVDLGSPVAMLQPRLKRESERKLPLLPTASPGKRAGRTTKKKGIFSGGRVCVCFACTTYICVVGGRRSVSVIRCCAWLAIFSPHPARSSAPPQPYSYVVGVVGGSSSSTQRPAHPSSTNRDFFLRLDSAPHHAPRPRAL